MGIERPKERATFSIAASVKGQLDRIVPKSRRSSFVETAIADALRKEAVAQLKRTLEQFKGYSSGGEDSADVLRRLRQERGDYLAARHRRNDDANRS